MVAAGGARLAGRRRYLPGRSGRRAGTAAAFGAMAALADRGLEMSEEKTAIRHIEQGFDFLGFNIKKTKNVAKKRGWSVVDMKKDWKVIYPFQK